MADILKLLSLLTGSSQETLLNAKTETQEFFGIGELSNEHELRLVMQTLGEDMVRIFDPEKASQRPMHELVGIMIEHHIKRNDKEFLTIFNRVLVYYYKCDFKNTKSFLSAVLDFSDDFERAILEIFSKY